MHQCYQSLLLFCLIPCLWLTCVNAQDSELYRQVLGWSTDSATGCPNNCFGRGQCNNGVCDCLCGYVGEHCQIESCSSDGRDWFMTGMRNKKYGDFSSSDGLPWEKHWGLMLILSDCGCIGLIYNLHLQPGHNFFEARKRCKYMDTRLISFEEAKSVLLKDALESGSITSYWVNMKAPLIWFRDKPDELPRLTSILSTHNTICAQRLLK